MKAIFAVKNTTWAEEKKDLKNIQTYTGFQALFSLLLK